MGEPLVITVFLLTAVTMRFPFTCKQPLWAVQLVDGLGDVDPHRFVAYLLGCEVGQKA